MQNVEYIMRCTFLCFVGSFHFSLTSQEGIQENYDLTRALLSWHPLSQIQHHNCRALASVPLQPMDPCLGITRSSSTSQSIVFFISFSDHFLMHAYLHIRYAIPLDLFICSCRKIILCSDDMSHTHHVFLPQAYDYA